MSFFVKFVWGLVSTACKQTVGFAYGLRTLAKHATPQGLTPTVGTNHGHWENFRRKHVTMAKTWSCVFLVDSLFWLHFLVHTDKLVKGQHIIKVILTRRKLLPTGLKTYDNFLELVCVGAWLNFLQKYCKCLWFGYFGQRLVIHLFIVTRHGHNTKLKT